MTLQVRGTKSQAGRALVNDYLGMYLIIKKLKEKKKIKKETVVNGEIKKGLRDQM